MRLNGGIEREGRRVHPRSDWRPPTTRELALLVLPDEARCRKPWDAGLVAIPARLREAWWESAGGGGAPVNKLSENGSFASTETLYCRLTRQAMLDVVLDKLQPPLSRHP